MSQSLKLPATAPFDPEEIAALNYHDQKPELEASYAQTAIRAAQKIAWRALASNPPASPPPVAVDGWRPIESAPRDGTPILVCNALYDQNGFLPQAVRWRTYHPNAAGEECFRDSKGHKVERIAFWMPLPASPSVGGVAG